ncbi:hypothetical protein glysoja_040973 [Glycine soja]|uniref:DUF7086 domain-containing protein n=2 Tax=Glycine soja TaxID=3848 RepID=A0A0B2QYI1_GLYSO|nr:hypothetical protein glysoja_040973 [Glycine soja]
MDTVTTRKISFQHELHEIHTVGTELSVTVTAKASVVREWLSSRLYFRQQYVRRKRLVCNRCNERFEMEIDVESKLGELLKFIQKKKGRMHDRAPKVWVEPVLPRCQHCGRENSVEPLIADTKRKDINWLFLLLAQMLGCCTVKQLKYFCKHTNSHRTGAKDRLVYSTYMGLCKQLLPELFGSCS